MTPERLAAGHGERSLMLLRQKERDPGSISLCRLLQAVMFPDYDATQLESFIRLRINDVIEDGILNQGYFRLRYEDLVTNRTNPLETYLGLELQADVPVEASLRRVVRTRTAGLWRNWLTSADVSRLRPLMRRYMVVFRYPDDWELAREAVIPPEHCSVYFERVLAERRRKLEAS